MSSIRQEKNSSTTSLNSMASSIVSSPSKSTRNHGASPTKRKSTSLPAETVDYLKAWMMSPEHIAHPYPTEQEKAQIMADTGIELKQLTNWFVNNRKRYWKPRVEARLQQQVQLPVASPSSIKRRASGTQLAPTIDVIERGLLVPSANTKVATKAVNDHACKPPVTREGVMSTSPLLVRPVVVSQAVVSDASSSASCASDTGSVFSSTNEDELMGFDYHQQGNDELADGTVARSETVDVHILRPLNGVRPTIADVSILSTVPQERILFTYENITLTYRFAAEAIRDRKKVQNRRDGEIVRLKRRFLKQYVEETSAPSIKRTFASIREGEMSPRKRFCFESPKIWKEACKAAEDLYDTDLPTLEEATLLFGFSRGISA